MTGTKRPGDGSPSTSNLTIWTGESFGLGEDDEIDGPDSWRERVTLRGHVRHVRGRVGGCSIAAEAHTGGRPTGSNNEASRKIKQAKKDALTSATKACAAERQAGQGRGMPTQKHHDDANQ